MALSIYNLIKLKEEKAKPFLKRAGGKTKLIPDIEKIIPVEFINSKFTYIEPFVGSGAILFWMLKSDSKAICKYKTYKQGCEGINTSRFNEIEIKL